MIRSMQRGIFHSLVPVGTSGSQVMYLSMEISFTSCFL